MFFPLFTALFLSTLNPALAQDAEPNPTQMTGEHLLAHCQDKWGSRTSAVAQCVTNLRLASSEARDEQIVAELEEGRERDEDILERFDNLTESVDQLATTQQHPAVTQSPPQQTQTTYATSGMTYARTGGAAWAPVHQPTVVSIHSLTGMVPDTLHITSLEHPTARKTCGGEGAPLVVFYDNGVPVTNVFAPVGAPTGFLEVYYDKQNDGIPDGTVMALDLGSQTDIWITWSTTNNLTVRYLRPGGQIAVEGLPLQTVYHPTTRSETSASGAIGCDRDASARRGGHQAIPAYSLSRMW